MQKETEQKLKELYRQLRQLRTYEHALAILSFDFETCAPRAAREAEAEVMSVFSNQHFKRANSKKMQALTVYLYERRAELDPLDRVLLEKLYETYRKIKNVTPRTQLRWAQIGNRAYINWMRAKEAGDFALFAPSLTEMVETARESVSLREGALPDLYDNLLDDCEKGVLTADLDPFFAELKEGLRTLMGRIARSGHVIRRDFLTRSVPIYKQQAFSEYLLRLNGYDFDRGCLSTTEHPFTIDVAQNDARVTTHYHETMVLSNIYSIIHEGGHAIFMQNERPEDYDHFINDSITNGMHESVSRFFENVIGRSEAYIHLIYPEFHKVFAEELGDVTERELYEAVNIAEPSLVRTEADEVTYGLHIVIRYEMEKRLLSGKLAVKDAAKQWNELYRTYLGVSPANDAEGILQDVHWTGGFGYFPSYALGNAYNAMYLARIRRELDFDGCIRRGDFAAINGWLRENVFAAANEKTPKEWLAGITGGTLSAKPFLDYLNEKYSDIYQL